MKRHISFSMILCLLGTTLLLAEPEFTIPELLESATSQQLNNADRALIYEQAIAQHMNNEEAFTESIDALLKIYDEQNEPEKAIRLFIKVLANEYDLKKNDNTSTTKIEDFLGPRMKKYQTLYPELNQKLTAEFWRQNSDHNNHGTVGSILQRTDEIERERGLEELSSLLDTASDVETKKKGLRILQQVQSAKFDRAPFLRMVEPQLDSESPDVRALALACLPNLNPDQTVIEKVIELADDEQSMVRQEIPRVLIQIDQGNSPEIVIPVLMKLMTDENERVRERAIKSHWGTYSSPEYDRFLVEQALRRHQDHDILYFCLSPMKSKSPEVCKYLVSVLDDPDWNNSGRAAWGLTYGVVDEAKPIVEEGVLRALPQETNSQTREKLFTVLKNVGSDQSRPYLESVISSEMETDQVKKLAQSALDHLN